jgi:hypothetical protein
MRPAWRIALWVQAILLAVPITFIYAGWVVFLFTPNNPFRFNHAWPPAQILAPTAAALASLASGWYLTGVALIRGFAALERSRPFIWWVATSGVFVALLATGAWFIPGGDPDTYSLVHLYFRSFAWGMVLIPMLIQLAIGRRRAKV